MAVVDDRDSAGMAPASPRAEQVQWFINVAGAITSVALVIGVGVWGYKLAVRDVAGIPVVRALEGPMRIAPQEPGGEIAANTGLSVNEVAAVGAAADLPEQMVLAPRPIDLTEEDRPAADLAAIDAAPETTKLVSLEASTLAPAVAVPADPGLPVLAPGELTETASLAPVEATTLADPAPGSDAALAAEPQDALESSIDTALAEALGTDVAAVEAADTEVAPAGAMTRSPRPARRPEGDASPEVPTRVEADTGALEAPGEIDIAALTPGTRLVQLGAFDDEAGARSEWASLQVRFGDLIASKVLVLEGAQSGGRTFVRLRALGFEDEADARRFCSALLAEKATCIPVTYRP